MAGTKAHKYLIRFLIAASALSALATSGGCASAGPRTQSGGLPADCILNRSIRDYEALDNRNLIIYGPGHQAFHVVLASPSVDLEHEFTIGIYDTDGRICPYGGDAILIDGVIPERIQIRSIEAIDKYDVEALEVEFGITESAGDAVTVTPVE